MGISKEEFTKEQLKAALYKYFKTVSDDYFYEEFENDDNLNEDGDDLNDYYAIAAEAYADRAYEKVIQNMQWPSFASGHYPDGTSMFEHEFLYHPACLIYDNVEESYLSDFDFNICMEIWLLADESVAEVEAISFKLGNFEFDYRTVRRMIDDDNPAPIDSEDMIIGLNNLIDGCYDKEDSDGKEE